ncbi:MAG: DNA polymerase III subunit gamma/tau [Halieaceae bacterium]|jgi:DNA polymerase-3 subunit gamma/tau|nr:DNA polymerase III subunit gamma/tau [Halieaceae bacterium]
MSYQVLARKWRPASFGEMMGQQHVLRALINALDNDRLHHAYLFTGTRGVGKTTVARILAKCLNCERGVSATPCGECASCVEIAEGRSVDLLEVDAASRTKVEDTRDLLDNVQYAPTRSRYKIYLIDEVHMLSTHSFNALLKTLEEPPPHAKFLLATTDPQKLPATILSRCLQFNLKNMLPEEVVSRLEHILGEEQVEFDAESLQLIARAAEGSMRDALSLTDQAIAFAGGRLVAEEVRAMLGTVDRGRVLTLAEAVLAADPARVLEQVRHIAEHAPDYAATLSELGAILHQVTIAQMVPEALDPAWSEQARLIELATSASPDEVQLCYQLAVSGRGELAMASDPRAGLEMVLLRMIAFRPAVVIDDAAKGAPPAKKPEPPALPVATPATSEPSGAPASRSAPVPPSPAPSMPDRERVSPAALAPRSNGESAENRVVSRGAAPAVSDERAAPDASEGSEAVLPGSGGSQPMATEIVSPEAGHLAAKADWPRLYERLGLTGLLASVALHTEWVGAADGRVRLRLDERNATLYNDKQRPVLAAALSKTFGRPIEVDIEIGTVGEDTPAAYRARQAESRLAAAEAALATDPRLQSLLDDFDAELIPGSIRPPSMEQEAHETQ